MSVRDEGKNVRKRISEIYERSRCEQSFITERFNRPVSKEAAIVLRGGVSDIDPVSAEKIAKAILESAGLKHEPTELKPRYDWKL